MFRPRNDPKDYLNGVHPATLPPRISPHRVEHSRLRHRYHLHPWDRTLPLRTGGARERSVQLTAVPPHLARAAVEQGDTEGLLQLLDLHGHGRLRDRAAFRRPAEMPGSGDGVEIAELLQCDVQHKLNLSNRSENENSFDRLVWIDSKLAMTRGPSGLRMAAGGRENRRPL